MELIDVIHGIIQETLKASHPTDVIFGTVTNTAPLSVQLETSMLPIPAEALILTDSVVGRSATVSGTTSDGASYTVVVPVQTDLQVGEKVVMLRCAAGQRFIILSRVRG